MSLKNFENLEKHANLSREDTIQFLYILLKNGKVEGIVRRMKFLHHSIRNHTGFMDECENVKMSTRIKALIEKIKALPKCKWCGGDVIRINKKENWFSDYCSVACSKKSAGHRALETTLKRNGGIHHNATEEGRRKTKQTNMERHGVDNWMKTEEGKQKCRENFHSREAREKVEQTMLRNYGVKNIGQAYHIFDDSRQQTNKRIYGGHPFTNNNIQTKKRKTIKDKYGNEEFFLSDYGRQAKIKGMMKKYGTENYFKTDEFREYIVEYNKRMYGTHHHLQSKESMTTIQDKEWCINFIKTDGLDFDKMMKDSNTSLTTVLTYLEMHGLYESKERVSILEDMISLFLDEHDIVHEINRFFDRKQADIYIPSANLAIECNGNYFHSTLFKDSKYHLEKTKHFESIGIQLIHLFEDEILEKFDIIKRLILHKCGKSDEKLYARKLVVAISSASKCNDFYEENHIQGRVKATTHLALKHGDEIVACMSFKDYGRNLTTGQHELVRFASSKAIIGGFSKLMKFYTRSYDPEAIISYADRRISQGDVYIKNGFVCTKVTPPSYSYINKKNYMIRERKEKYKKSRLQEKFNAYDPELSEAQNMERFGFVRIYDCGLIKYEWKR